MIYIFEGNKCNGLLLDNAPIARGLISKTIGFKKTIARGLISKTIGFKKTIARGLISKTIGFKKNNVNKIPPWGGDVNQRKFLNTMLGEL